MRTMIVILLTLVIDCYAFQAFRLLTSGWSSSSRQIFTLVYFALTCFTIVYLLGSQRHWWDGVPRTITIYVTALVYILFFSKFLVAGVVLIDDLRRLLMWMMSFFLPTREFSLNRSQMLSTLGVFLGFIPLLTLTYGMIRNQYRYKLFQTDVPIRGLPANLEGLRIVQISDIHSGSFTFKEPIKHGIKMINDLKPDLVMFTGDLVNTTADEMDPYLEIFSKIESKYGIYSVLGNHDYGDYKAWPTQAAKSANLDKLKQIHAHLGWKLLLNQHELTQIKGATVAVIGVENISASTRFRTYGNLAAAYQGSEGADLKILLSHDPSHWTHEVVKSFEDIILTLSGHTHGFQFGIEIPGWVKWSPSKYVYKQWAGLYSSANQYLYVNRGFGTLAYPGRVGILPEITLLQLKSA